MYQSATKQAKPKKEILDIQFDLFRHNIWTRISALNLIKKKEIITDDLLDSFLNQDYNDETGKYQDLIFRLISTCKGFDNINEESIKRMAASYQFNLVFQKLIELGKNIPDLCFSIAIYNNNSDLIQYMIDKLNIQCLDRHLELACRYSDIKTISCILQQKVIPNQKCFNNIIEPKYSIYKYEYNKFFGISASHPSSHCKIHELNNVPKLKLLCDYGYVIKQEDFVNMLASRLYIKNYKNYNLELTDEVHKTCNKVLFFPYKEIKLTKYGYKNLLRKSINLTNLKKIEKYFNVDKDMPNIDCLKVALKNSSLSASIITYLIDQYNIKPDFECLGIAIKYNSFDIVKKLYEKIEEKDKAKEKVKDKVKDKVIKIKEIGDGLIDFESESESESESKINKAQKQYSDSEEFEKDIDSDSDSDSYSNSEEDFEEDLEEDSDKELYEYDNNRRESDSSEYDEEEKPKPKEKKIVKKKRAYSEDSEDSEDY